MGNLNQRRPKHAREIMMICYSNAVLRTYEMQNRNPSIKSTFVKIGASNLIDHGDT